MATAFGDRVRAHRLSRGLSQDRLAAAAGMAVRTLRDIEHGRVRRPRARSVRDLAAALELAPAEREDLVAAAAGGAGAAVEVAVLGPLEVRRPGRPAVPVRRLPGTLLGLLAIQADRVVGRDEIIDVLWGEAPPPTSRDLLRAYAGQVRALLGGGPELLAVSAAGYRLQLDAGRLDLGRFEELAARGLAAGRSGDRPEAVRMLAEALATWRGPVLVGAGDRVRLHPAAVALDRRRVEVALAYADLALAAGAADRVVAVLGPVAAAEPLHEGLQARLVLALAAAGDQAGALRLHAAVRRRLADELGVTPGKELAAAHLTVLRTDRSAALGAADRPVPAELPADTGAFSGRDAELAGLDRLLAAAPAG
ncbi:MAG TPA: BTAD domain-containing putative transcriptional regulator, partial [Actinoplanes sp.]|nr:BTAD domain-containing putative transcriptional regulator [Actinoplanes sp.]